ncbi:hypothetical protein NEUTE1DRAFT_115012 [Neurospora tetrasperma FGSC 2508]|uniref:Uncharacterized protein n=1 Tax=Neurospora tetrasperma (strain FGSC 2508 / ATCC MYA-4615 / P0657) TaxID=510951 RepID=F8N1N3_NEUT8|nr:uncharacterized protein NEUTE1DRAFT_115012 [Neurospora tetrasperma FGSC 2508]EGO53159.1 hypothetical protein NEUTE1DRAFT_115012 [Neurospora tetrasperma FGSC 2508]
MSRSVYIRGDKTLESLVTLMTRDQPPKLQTLQSLEPGKDLLIPGISLSYHSSSYTVDILHCRGAYSEVDDRGHSSKLKAHRDDHRKLPRLTDGVTALGDSLFPAEPQQWDIGSGYPQQNPQAALNPLLPVLRSRDLAIFTGGG